MGPLTTAESEMNDLYLFYFRGVVFGWEVHTLQKD